MPLVKGCQHRQWICCVKTTTKRPVRRWLRSFICIISWRECLAGKAVTGERKLESRFLITSWAELSGITSWLQDQRTGGREKHTSCINSNAASMEKCFSVHPAWQCLAAVGAAQQIQSEHLWLLTSQVYCHISSKQCFLARLGPFNIVLLYMAETVTAIPINNFILNNSFLLSSDFASVLMLHLQYQK